MILRGKNNNNNKELILRKQRGHKSDNKADETSSIDIQASLSEFHKSFG
jgi:hypothetical protein